MVKHYVFTDFETTGLDANEEVLLEGALIIVDVESGGEVARWGSLIDNRTDNYLTAIQRVIHNEDQYVNNMHTASGLWDAWNDDTVPHMATQEWSLYAIDWLYGFGVNPQSAPMAGNSIGSLDRPFALRHLPEFSKFLHYRNFDVSTIRMWVEANAPEVEESWVAHQAKMGLTTHRAMDDCVSSVNQWKWYTKGLKSDD